MLSTKPDEIDILLRVPKSFLVISFLTAWTVFATIYTTVGAEEKPKPQPPTCATNAADNITYNSARLNGTVNPNGLDTTAYFNLGVTESYTVMLTSETVDSGSSNVPVSVTVTSLSTNTMYNFRVIGINSTGTTYGNNLTFNTLLPPPSSTTNAATNVTYNSATLNGTINPNGLDATAYFNYGLNVSYTVTTTSQTLGIGTSNVVVSATVRGLSSNTLYNFRCAATNSSGTINGNNLTFTTPPPPPPSIKWSGTIESNFSNAKFGPSDTSNATFKSDIYGETKILKLYSGLLYLRGKTDNNLTSFQRRAEVKCDRKLTADFYSYLQHVFEDNQITKLEMGSRSSGGLSYNFLKTDALRESIYAGASYNSEEYENLTLRNRTYSYQFINNFYWKVAKGWELSHKYEYLPNSKNLKKFRSRSDGSVRLYLSKHLYSNFEIINEYDNKPVSPGTPKHNATMLLTMGFRF